MTPKMGAETENPSTSTVKKASNGRRVSFHAVTDNGSKSNLNELSMRSNISELSFDSKSESSKSFPSLGENLMRVQKKKDPFKYYDVLQIMGSGSMGSVCMVKKRTSAVGGSARHSFVRREKASNLANIIPCISFCIPGNSAEETKPSALVNTDDISAVTVEDYGVVYALKSIILNQVRNKIYVKELQNEIAILKTLDHPNICKAIETYEFKDQLYLVLELCSGGDLYSRDPYDEMQARHIVHSVLDACAFLHKRNIIHRDLKYENIMFASPTSPNVKIIDFGLSKKYFENELISQTVGTVYTMAPEVIDGNYDDLCDVWSIGVLAFMLMSSSLPFFGRTRGEVIERIKGGRFYFKSRRWDAISPEAKDFVTSLLTQDVRYRPSSSDALTHEWFKGCGESSNMATTQVVSTAVMDRVQATIQTFAGYNKLKKLALYVIAHKSSADEIGFLQQLFRIRFDIEKDGVLTLDEFKNALEVYSYTDDEIEKMFSEIDIDGGDDLAYSEFLAATIEAHGPIEEGRIAEAFDRLDCDDTGFITVSNLRDFLGKEVATELIDEIIDEVDFSHDHMIDYDEFLGLWEGDFEEVLEKNLKEVRSKRVVRESVYFQSLQAGLEDGEDGEFLEEESKVSLESAPPGAGRFFFDQEKEKSTRGIWF